MAPQLKHPNGIPGKDDFFWSNKMEPHALRKKALLKKYGKEINRLLAMGPDGNTKFICFFVVMGHILFASWACELPFWQFLLAAYVVGASCAHNLFLAIHEVTHFTAFKNKFANDLLAMFTNIPIVIPYAMYFKEYHYEHHRYQGWHGVDMDIPTAYEGRMVQTFFGKCFFLLFHGFFYAIRPMMIRPLPFTGERMLGAAVVIMGDIVMYKFFGWKILAYLLISLVFGTGITPFAGHFISEHYLLGEQSSEAQETHSYYGPLNFFAWNIGYHNEHHDFPSLPFSRLAALKQLAPEFYEPLIQTPSWFGAQLQFLFSSRMTAFCRMLREEGAGQRKKSELLPTTPDAANGGMCFSCDEDGN